MQLQRQNIVRTVLGRIPGRHETHRPCRRFVALRGDVKIHGRLIGRRSVRREVVKRLRPRVRSVDIQPAIAAQCQHRTIAERDRRTRAAEIGDRATTERIDNGRDRKRCSRPQRIVGSRIKDGRDPLEDGGAIHRCGRRSVQQTRCSDGSIGKLEALRAVDFVRSIGARTSIVHDGVERSTAIAARRDRVLLAIAGEDNRVGACTAIDRIVATTAGDDVVACAACQCVCKTRAGQIFEVRNRVAAGTYCVLRRCGRQANGDSRRRGGVTNRICSGSPVHDVIASSTFDDVVSRVTGQRIVECRAENAFKVRDRIGASSNGILSRGRCKIKRDRRGG